jgi:hypothetical protein
MFAFLLVFYYHYAEYLSWNYREKVCIGRTFGMSCLYTVLSTLGLTGYPFVTT